MYLLKPNGYGYGDSYGNGDGYGDGYSNGDGPGHLGDGYGDGFSDGHGDGYGYGYNSGNGRGYGHNIPEENLFTVEHLICLMAIRRNITIVRQTNHNQGATP